MVLPPERLGRTLPSGRLATRRCVEVCRIQSRVEQGDAMFVDDKVVMIVGAGPGLGATLARRCAEDGADLVLAARTASTLARIAEDTRAAGGRVVAVPTDVSDREQVRSLVEQAVAEYARIDVL